MLNDVGRNAAFESSIRDVIKNLQRPLKDITILDVGTGDVSLNDFHLRLNLRNYADGY